MPRQQCLEADPRVGPVFVGGRAGDADCLGSVLDGQTGKIVELNQSSGLWILGGQTGQGFIDVEQLLSRRGETDINGVEWDTSTPAAALVGLLASGLIHEDAAHGFGRGGEEMAAAVPLLLLLVVAHEPQISFVNQGGSLECLPGRLPGQPMRRQLPQLLIDERQKLLGGLRIALLDGAQNAGDLAHCRSPTYGISVRARTNGGRLPQACRPRRPKRVFSG